MQARQQQRGGMTAPVGVLGSSHWDALRALGFTYLRHRAADKAISLFEGLRELEPADARLGPSLAYAYLLADRHQDALGLAQSLLRTETRDRATLHLLCARALLGLERLDEARREVHHYYEARNVS